MATLRGLEAPARALGPIPMEPRTDDLLPTRWSLLSRLKDWDDQESWREFYDTYWRLIYCVAIKSGLTDAEAQDVVQQTVIAVAMKMPGFKADPAHGSFKAWLLNLTRWRITDQLRRRAREHNLHRPIKSDDSARTSTVERIADPASAQFDAAWDAEWEKNLLRTALERVKAQVKPELFQVFDLLVEKQWPPAQIARRLHVSLARVYYTKYKLQALLRREVKRLKRQALE